MCFITDSNLNVTIISPEGSIMVSVICYLLSVVCCLLSVVCWMLFVVCCLLFVVCCKKGDNNEFLSNPVTGN